ncbi:transcription initiation factor IIB [Haloglomus halophilum]|jgi:transcription initiation factor TFIIB|uniref:transcription initiation factor IIB n=1 Tax=Haloglomus halophilum TaxID=2962672 RepID=UPI0020C93A15|nr:transcription initiation factor IIB family protein [Haloglomus halophilum]
MQTGAIYKRTFDESSGKQSTNGCPECGGRVNTTGHETVCEDCGLVLAESAVDRGPEWRSFEDDAGEPDGRRTGPPLTPTKHDNGLSTEIGWQLNGAGSGPSGRQRRRLARLRKQHRRANCRSKRERNLIGGLYEVNRVASALGLSKPLEERACVLFRSAQDAGLLPGRSIEAMATASVYATCRCSDTARLLADFVPVSRVGESSVTNAYAVLNREFGLPTPPPSPDAYLPQFASELDLGSTVERRARRVLEVAEEQGIENGRNPAGVAAACLLVAAREVGCPQPPTQTAFAEVADVSPVTLRSRRDELLTVRNEPCA